jgi:hypothetical protein
LILVFAAVVEYAYICVAVRVHERRKEEFYSTQNGVNGVDGHTKVASMFSQKDIHDNITINIDGA